tara:strand:+ start:4428 stop:4625 length:198 start_codon:yes stop_codon:yes gene_type:complete
MVMAWKMPLLNRTVKSLGQASRQAPQNSSATEAAQKRYQRVRDLARKRLAMAENPMEEDTPQPVG